MGAQDQGLTGAELVKKALENRDLREVARQLAGPDAAENDITKWRRPIYRIMEGKSVVPPTAEAIERELQLAPGSIPRYRPGARAKGARMTHPQLVRNLESLSTTVERLGNAMAILVAAQEPSLRARLTRALEGR